MAHKIDQLQTYISKVLDLPEDMLDDSRRQWDGLAVLVRSLGQRVPAGWDPKEINVCMKLDYEPKTFPLAGDHLILCFRAEKDCALVRNAGP